MLSRFDDYPIHQTPDPVAHPATSDKDVYERYWFNGYSTSGDFYLGAGAALYQHLGVKDAHVSFIHEGRQYAFHVSGRRSDEPSDLTIGPYSLEIIEPMRSCRITVAENDTDFTCDLLWEGRTGNVEEPRHHLGRGLRKIMDTTRFTQLGRWTGWVQFGDVRIELDPSEVACAGGPAAHRWRHPWRADGLADGRHFLPLGAVELRRPLPALPIVRRQCRPSALPGRCSAPGVRLTR